LSEMLALPIDGGRNFGLADISRAVGAIHRLQNSLTFDPIPQKDADTGVDEFERARSIVADHSSVLSDVLRLERDQLLSRANNLRTNFRGKSIRAHFARIDEDIETVAKHLKTAAPDRVAEWKSSYNNLKPRFEAEADVTVQNFLASFRSADDFPVK